MKKSTKSAVAEAAESKFVAGARAAIDNLSRVMRKCGIKDLKISSEVYDRGDCAEAFFRLDSPSGTLTGLEQQIVLANLITDGGFYGIDFNEHDDHHRLMRWWLTYGHKPAEPAFVYKEFTLGELVQIVKKDKATFPNGLKTKLSLGDFEGNTYHRKISVGADDGRLYLSYELNERDEQ